MEINFPPGVEIYTYKCNIKHRKSQEKNYLIKLDNRLKRD